MKQFFLGLVLVLGAALPLWSNVGEITYFEGTVTITRDQQVLQGPDLDFGDPVENMDMIRTGPASLIEIRLNPSTGITGVIRLEPSSAFYLELSNLRNEQTAGLEMVRGSMAVRVNRMAGRSGLEVRSGGAVMGVRGTEFRVMAAPAGEMLVTTTEGRVSSRSPDGQVVDSVPGTVVEINNGIRAIPVTAATLAGFERQWMAERIEVFRAQAPRAITQFAQRYEEQYQQFQQAYAQLEEQRPVLNKWLREYAAGEVGTTMEQLREKRSLIGPLMAMRRSMVLFEWTYSRLTELRDYMSSSVQAHAIRSGYTIGDFYRRLDRDAVTIERQMNLYRLVLKMYAERNNGETPLDIFSDNGNSGRSGGASSPTSPRSGGARGFFD